MDRLQSLLDSLIVHHEQMVKSGADWKKESFVLGKITGIRTAIKLMNEPNSVVPSDIIH